MKDLPKQGEESEEGSNKPLAATSNNKPSIGLANTFISHTWRSSFLDFLDALENFPFKHSMSYQQHKTSRGITMELEPIYLWIDLFSNNQNGLQDPPPFEWWCETFKGAIAAMHQVVMIISPWENPIPLKRAWCLWEIYCAIETKSKFSIAMCTREKLRFETMIVEKSEVFYDMLGNVDLRHSEAFNPLDKERIFEVVERTVGIGTLNIMVTTRLREWVVASLKGLVNSREDDWFAQYSGKVDKVEDNHDEVEEEVRDDDLIKKQKEIRSLNYRLIYSAILSSNGNHDGASYQMRQVELNIQDLEWADKSFFQCLVDIVKAELIVQNNEGQKLEKYLPAVLTCWAKCTAVKNFTTVDYERAKSLFNHGIQGIENHIKTTQLEGGGEGGEIPAKVRYWYLRALRGRCALLLIGMELTQEMADHYFEKTASYTPENSRERAEAFAILSQLYRLQGDFEASLEAVLQASKIYELILSDSHPVVINFFGQIGDLNLDLARFNTAQKYFSKAYWKALEKFPPESKLVKKIQVSYSSISFFTCHWYSLFKLIRPNRRNFIMLGNVIDAFTAVAKLRILNIPGYFAFLIMVINWVLLVLLTGFMVFTMFAVAIAFAIPRLIVLKILYFIFKPRIVAKIMFSRRKGGILSNFMAVVISLITLIAGLGAIPISIIFGVCEWFITKYYGRRFLFY